MPFEAGTQGHRSIATTLSPVIWFPAGRAAAGTVSCGAGGYQGHFPRAGGYQGHFPRGGRLPGGYQDQWKPATVFSMNLR
jgi:hypothetical protein